MKKYIITVCILITLLFLGYTIYYRHGVYIDITPDVAVTSFVTVNGKNICLKQGQEDIPFEVRGVDMGVGMPGKWATDYAIDKEMYFRWFGQIQDMGANTVRVYTILQDDFYDAFYEYNRQSKEPLYLIHGVWINDYVFNSHRDAYDEELLDPLLRDCRAVVDIIHGKKSLSLGDGGASGTYRKDISPWVLGYIIGVEWESSLVVYTNEKSWDKNSYQGTYLYTEPEATAFEAFLCQVGDQMIQYESSRYKQQRLVAFSNWPTTDPFVYPIAVTSYRYKIACVDVEHIKAKETFLSGMFASYHVYPYFPDYLQIMKEGERYSQRMVDERLGEVIRKNLEYHTSRLNGAEIEKYLTDRDYYDSRGRYNTYRAYLKALNRYHTIPVIISEYGVTTGSPVR